MAARIVSLAAAVETTEATVVMEGSTMQARSTLRPGQPGTKALVRQYGDRLLCVRYRYDRLRRKRYKTAEVIVDEAPWEPPPPAPETLVYVRVAWGEAALARQIKLAGGQWQRGPRLWALRYDAVVRLGLLERLVDPPLV